MPRAWKQLSHSHCHAWGVRSGVDHAHTDGEEAAGVLLLLPPPPATLPLLVPPCAPAATAAAAAAAVAVPPGSAGSRGRGEGDVLSSMMSYSLRANLGSKEGAEQGRGTLCEGQTK